jgi:5'-nucleotidase
MKSRRQFIWQGSLAATAFLAAKPIEGIAKSTNLFKAKIGFGNTLTILQTANINNTTNALNSNNFVGLGGFKNTSRLISKIKSDAANTLLLDCGNIFSKNIEQEEHQPLLKMVQQSGYDALALGKHELMHERIESMNQFGLPLLQDTETPYTIVKKGNLRIGLITAAAKNNLFATNVIESINDMAKKLSVVHECNLVVCLSTLGYKNSNKIDDVHLASSSEYIDLILGNEDNLFMKTPEIAQNKNKNEVIINHVGRAGVVLGNFQINFDEEGLKKSVVFDNLMVGTENNRWKKLTA